MNRERLIIPQSSHSASASESQNQVQVHNFKHTDKPISSSILPELMKKLTFTAFNGIKYITKICQTKKIKFAPNVAVCFKKGISIFNARFGTLGGPSFFHILLTLHRRMVMNAYYQLQTPHPSQ